MDSQSNLLRKWTVLEIAFLGLFVLIKSTGAHILVYRSHTNQLIEEYNDLPAQFGPSLPPNGLKVFPVKAIPTDGCSDLKPPSVNDYPLTAKFVAIIERGGENCTFESKVRRAQNAHFQAVIVFNNVSDDLEQMSAKDSIDINIPSVFVGHTTGLNLISFFTSDVILVINDELPFNINTQLILPFSILIGLCFLIMIFYMIYKCIREERRLRRYRLPKSMLKKLPIMKFTKTNDLSYDTCVICLEEFIDGDKLRVLPCKHPYHSHCIDPWLTENRRVCPICKRKVFTKGEVRTNRNRQSSLDSVTDTDDDMTPLLRGSAVATSSSPAATTHHGTFARRADDSVDVNVNNLSDDENVLLTHPTLQQQNIGRVNPFDVPSNSITQNNAEPRRAFSFFRFFRRQQPISIAAPPYLEEVVDSYGRTASAAIAAAVAERVTPATPIPSSNNILNPNLSGSLKDDDDESPQHSIYEPIAIVTPATTITAQDMAAALISDADSVFIQTPSQGGIGVVALPNTNMSTMPTQNRRQQRSSSTNNNQFLI